MAKYLISIIFVSSVLTGVMLKQMKQIKKKILEQVNLERDKYRTYGKYLIRSCPLVSERVISVISYQLSVIS